MEVVIATYTAANQDTRAPATIAQYASGLRNAVRGFLHQRGTEEPGTIRRSIDLADGRSVTVIAPACDEPVFGAHQGKAR